MLNAKNSYGAYTGYKPAFFLINNSRVVQALVSQGGERDFQGMQAQKICNEWPG
jgi:hypothetical protein